MESLTKQNDFIHARAKLVNDKIVIFLRNLNKST